MVLFAFRVGRAYPRLRRRSGFVAAKARAGLGAAKRRRLVGSLAPPKLFHCRNQSGLTAENAESTEIKSLLFEFFVIFAVK
jgi:hypothetical protein